MKKANIMIIGGFLGSGKTTSIVAIAKYLIGEGKKAGIIVNEQGSRLVDLEYLRQKGYEVIGVTQSCLSCSCKDLVATIDELIQYDKFDYILIEPSGSCTGLARTMMKHLQENNKGDYRLLPLSVLVDPTRLLSELITKEQHLPPEAGILMLKQMEEADIIVVNKADALSKEEIQKIDQFLHDKYDKKKILYINAMLNSGIDTWLDKIEKLSESGYPKVSNNEVYDKEKYANTEATLTRMNFQCDFSIPNKTSGNYLLNTLTDCIKDHLRKDSSELVHLKVFLESGYATCRLSTTSNHDENSFDKKISVPVGSGTLFINICAYRAPENLQEVVELALNTIFEDVEGTYENMNVECFTPNCQLEDRH